MGFGASWNLGALMPGAFDMAFNGCFGSQTSRTTKITRIKSLTVRACGPVDVIPAFSYSGYHTYRRYAWALAEEEKGDFGFAYAQAMVLRFQDKHEHGAV
jgi:hypothetical protein